MSPTTTEFGSPSRLVRPGLLEEPRWYALRTRARHEKKVHSQLESRGVESYPAVVELERQWADRTRRVGMPLFPGYVFAWFPLKDLAEVLSTVGVATVVRVDGVPTPLRDEEIESVRRLARGVEETGQLPEHEDYLEPLEPGETVRVMSGPYEGMQGVLLEVRGNHRVTVRLPALRQAVSVEFKREWLEGVGGG